MHDPSILGQEAIAWIRIGLFGISTLGFGVLCWGVWRSLVRRLKHEVRTGPRAHRSRCGLLEKLG